MVAERGFSPPQIADVPVPSIQTQLSNIVDVLDAIRKNLGQMQNDLFHVKTNHEDLVMKHIDDKVTDVPVVLQREAPMIQKMLKTADDSTIRAQIAELLKFNASESEDEQPSLREYVDVPYANPITQAVPQMQYIDETIDVPVGVQRRVPTIQTAQGTVEVPQVRFLDRVSDIPVATQLVEVPKIVSQDKIQRRTTEQVMDIPVPQVDGFISAADLRHVMTNLSEKLTDEFLSLMARKMKDTDTEEQLVEAFKVFFQDRVQQRIVEQITENLAVSLGEENTIQETIDIPVPHAMEKTIEVVKLIPQERIQNRTVEQIIHVPVLQETVEVPRYNSSMKPRMFQSSCRDRCPSSKRCRRL